MEPIVQVRNIYKDYNKTEVLKGISFDIFKGEIVSIIGSSGSGKSTLIRCINGLEKIKNGEIIVDKKVVGDSRSVIGKVGMVFQDFNLFPHYTVLENIVNPCKVIRKMNTDEAKELAMSLLKKVKLEDKINEYPKNLSGGQQQRVAIARALSMEPEVILFDEPTSSLDPELAYEVFNTMKSLAKEGFTMVIVTHQINMVTNFSNRVIFLENGKISFDGSPKELMETDNERVKQFIKMIAL
ncbi:glutamine transport ATP-binding protein GlnQ [Gottschalkia purinilytica]|uniref:Glutamine transport ATP-binding protein GlnQ n=1 Tax=Gottschalkia purinilytica TaxID=1503 RepID=A0A0L0W7W8_GOTPU|nr:amino acid ABC transporter ATP-binding protein [Gottschalkia purinilytica]KNF07527.1 glutamine transport ATP-binding protein GlnQ [Gottschalkia purinilytica]